MRTAVRLSKHHWYHCVLKNVDIREQFIINYVMSTKNSLKKYKKTGDIDSYDAIVISWCVVRCSVPISAIWGSVMAHLYIHLLSQCNWYSPWIEQSDWTVCTYHGTNI